MKGKVFGGIVIVVVVAAILIVGKVVMGDQKDEGSSNQKEIQGVVLNINEQGMEIERMTIQTMKDGSIVGETGVGNPTEKIFFTEDTQVVIKEMTRKADESVDTVEKGGSISSIQHMSSVTAHVQSKDGNYYADKIEIWINMN